MWPAPARADGRATREGSPCTDRIDALERQASETAATTGSASSGGQAVAAAACRATASTDQPTPSRCRSNHREPQAAQRATEADGGDRAMREGGAGPRALAQRAGQRHRLRAGGLRSEAADRRFVGAPWFRAGGDMRTAAVAAPDRLSVRCGASALARRPERRRRTLGSVGPDVPLSGGLCLSWLHAPSELSATLGERALINAKLNRLSFRFTIVSGMIPIRTGCGAAAATHPVAIVQIETLDGNGLSLFFATREAAEIAFRQVRTGSNVQHCALLTHLREGLYASGASFCRP
jgi:hypothetical protein